MLFLSTVRMQSKRPSSRSNNSSSLVVVSSEPSLMLTTFSYKAEPSINLDSASMNEGNKA